MKNLFKDHLPLFILLILFIGFFTWLGFLATTPSKPLIFFESDLPPAKSSQIQPGDIVRLKSGGPIMTVLYQPNHSPTHYVCSWFIEKQIFDVKRQSWIIEEESHSGYFPPGSLELIKKSKKAPNQTEIFPTDNPS